MSYGNVKSIMPRIGGVGLVGDCGCTTHFASSSTSLMWAIHSSSGGPACTPMQSCSQRMPTEFSFDLKIVIILPEGLGNHVARQAGAQISHRIHKGWLIFRQITEFVVNIDAIQTIFIDDLFLHP